jgi:DNA-binding response OmpR family regulator
LEVGCKLEVEDEAEIRVVARVVVLDEDDEFMELMAGVLAGLGHHVIPLPPTAADAGAIAAQSPELVVMDLSSGRVLPGLRLIWTLRRSGHQEIPVLVVSDDLGVLRRYRRVWKELGVATMFKPFDLDDFEQRVGRLVEAA